VNALAPPKEKRRLSWTTLKSAELTKTYRLLAFVQVPFSFAFWKIEQCKARIDIERERRRT
jgi:hypothetical protein